MQRCQAVCIKSLCLIRCFQLIYCCSLQRTDNNLLLITQFEPRSNTNTEVKSTGGHSPFGTAPGPEFSGACDMPHSGSDFRMTQREGSDFSPEDKQPAKQMATHSGQAKAEVRLLQGRINHHAQDSLLIFAYEVSNHDRSIHTAASPALAWQLHCTSLY